MSSSNKRKNCGKENKQSLHCPRPLSLTRKRCNARDDGTLSVSLIRRPLPEHEGNSIKNNSTTLFMYTEEQDSSTPFVTTIQRAALSTILSLKLINRQLMATRDRLRLKKKTEPPNEMTMKKEIEEVSNSSELKRRREDVNEIVADLTETRLHGMLTIWSDDMHFVFYSILKGENISDRNEIQPTREAIDFIKQFRKKHKS